MSGSLPSQPSCISRPRILIYILRRDIRLTDNPLFYHASLLVAKKSGFTKRPHREDSIISKSDTLSPTHLLPVYIFPANQIEVSGFLCSSEDRSPYPEARSDVAGIWRTGPHRAKFVAEGVWDLKERLEGLGCRSGLELRVGMVGEVIQHMLEWYAEDEHTDGGRRAEVAGIWMTNEEGTEEKRDEVEIRSLADQSGVEFKVWDDEKWFIDDRDIPFDDMDDLPNVYTNYRKKLEPLGSRPRRTIPTPIELPPLPLEIPPQFQPFEIPTSLLKLKRSLLSPLEKDPGFGLPDPPQWPPNAKSAYPFQGGESAAQKRLLHLVTSGAITNYKQTRNGLLGLDFSTKLSAYLAQGMLTARQVHWAMVDFEEGRGSGKDTEGYGKGENPGTYNMRFELLWRDYMRLCVKKFGARMFHIDGIRDISTIMAKAQRKRWKYLDRSSGVDDDPAETLEMFTRFQSGRTGMGLIDAANRELFLTGYTSNRARQNVASFLTSHLGIDWRVGAEWYEFLLIDYDIGNNWGNWQYVAGVGNDPREGRVFNPVKQSLDYDPQGEYIRAWVPELRGVRITKGRGAGEGSGGGGTEVDQQKLLGVYQAWKLSLWEKENLGLRGLEWVDKPLVKIDFKVGSARDQGVRRPGRGGGRNMGQDGEGWGRGAGRGRAQDGDSKGRGRGNLRGNLRDKWRGKGKVRDFNRQGNEDRI
ncbi:cryptochrome [Lindgomyces ingoldianus]|uniref:Cryptochrome n=1 Tax=Lindgomyces ingoldianus TaxID=673940 RepID=A0ACB6Q9E2_9PLEO|nr:cryptochrome [Lindgomyces ingoldianus]KAF2462987.1 cryptochrome [Lindgomyces ingoldianus]